MRRAQHMLLATLIAATACSGDEPPPYQEPRPPAPPPVAPGQSRGFGQLRTIIRSGQVPAPSVLSEDAFLDERSPPSSRTPCPRPVCLWAARGAGPDLRTGSARAWIAISLQPGALRPPHAPDHLVIALDNSSSMAGTPLTLAQRGLRALASSASQRSLRLLTFSDDIIISSPPREDSAASDWQTHVDRLRVQSGADLFGGLRASLQLAAASPNTRVIFLADGPSTVGILDERRLVEVAHAFGRQGVELTTIGIGTDYPARTLQDARAGSIGQLHRVEDLSQLPNIIEREANTRRIRLASDLTLHTPLASPEQLVRIRGAHNALVSSDRITITLNAAGIATYQGIEEPRLAAPSNTLLIELVASPDALSQPITLDLSFTGFDARPYAETITLAPLEPSRTRADSPQRGAWSDLAIERLAIIVSIHEAIEQALLAYSQQDIPLAVRDLERFIDALDDWLRDRDEQDIYQDLLLLRQLADTIRLRGGYLD